MTHTVTVTKLLDGNHPILHVHLKSDGVSPDLVNYELIDPADFGHTGPHKFLTLDALTYGLAGFSASLKFDYLIAGTFIWTLPEGTAPTVDFTYYGGLKDRSNPLDGTGKILLSTKGFGDSGDEGSIVIQLKK